MSRKSTTKKPISARSKKGKDSDYSRFDQIDGRHPWQSAMPEGHVLYETRVLDKGALAYFNFALAKEMGLIADNHQQRLTKGLEQKLLETFNLRIINEYDQVHEVDFSRSEKKPHPFMATRYLQLQHKNKKGATSGDGRAIWNGTFSHNGVIWDVSSRGTGVTSLAPGSVESDEPLQTGNTDFGYGCGLAEIDELYSAAIMAEIMHNKGIHTERVLAIIDLGDGNGIGVRASRLLFRPAHLFLHLKQENYSALKRGTDYVISRQKQNKIWDFGPRNKKRYQYLLDEVCESFARFAAQLEREYVFTWLDWDGDNVLMNAGIIDYGSVRQFGLRHDQYRYDDVERWSTNLNEQKAKARLTVQVFTQMVDYLETQNKKPLSEFKDSPVLKQFDKAFERSLLDYFLYQLGLKRQRRDWLLENHPKEVDLLYKCFESLEKVKTSKRPAKVADGINRPAIFNMRKILGLLPDFLRASQEDWDKTFMSGHEFFKLILADHASQRDSHPKNYTLTKIRRFQNLYKNLVSLDLEGDHLQGELLEISQRAQIINREERITGNSLIFIVNEIVKQRKQGMAHTEIQLLIDSIIAEQIFEPDIVDHHKAPRRRKSQRSKKIFKKVLSIVEGHKEDI